MARQLRVDMAIKDTENPAPAATPTPEAARPALTEAGAAAKAAREARRAAALRENLRRRKAQARARSAPPGKGDTPPTDTTSGS